MPNRRTHNRVPQFKYVETRENYVITKLPNGFLLVRGFLYAEASFSSFFYKLPGEIELHAETQFHKAHVF